MSGTHRLGLAHPHRLVCALPQMGRGRLAKDEDQERAERWLAGPGAPLTREDADRVAKAAAEGRVARRRMAV